MAGLSKALIQTLFEKKKNRSHFPTTGNWTACCKSVQKRAKQDQKNILCEWRAGRKPDRADDQRADMKWLQAAGFLTLFWNNYHTYWWLIAQDRTVSNGYVWIKKSDHDLLLASVRKSRHTPIFQPLITLMAHQNTTTTRRSATKKGLFNWWPCTVIVIFTQAYPEYVNKCVKVFFQWCSLHW